MYLSQIINTASMAGLAPGFGREMIGYSGSKHGVVALTRTMARDYRWGKKLQMTFLNNFYELRVH